MEWNDGVGRWSGTMEWNHGVEPWSGTMEWNHGVEPWSGTTEREGKLAFSGDRTDQLD